MPEYTQEIEELDTYEPMDAFHEDRRPLFNEASYPSQTDTTNSRFSLKTLTTGVVVALILLALTAGLAIIERNFIVKSWPAAALFFDTIGLPADKIGEGLSLENVKVNISSTVAAPGILAVSGSIVNSTKTDIILPNLKVQLNGVSGALKDWPLNLHSRVVAAGKNVAFEYLLKGAPAEGKTVTLFFIE